MMCIVIDRLWHTRIPIYLPCWAETPVEQRTESLKIRRYVEPWQLRFIEYERPREIKTQESERSACSLPAPSVSVQIHRAKKNTR